MHSDPALRRKPEAEPLHRAHREHNTYHLGYMFTCHGFRKVVSPVADRSSAAAEEKSALPRTDVPYLAPIEDPKDSVMQQTYAVFRANFGRVITPVKVHSARLPPSFLQYYLKMGDLDRELTLPAETVMLLRQQVARLNVCEFCIDAGRAGTIFQSMNQAKFDALGDFRTSRLFDERERSALEYATELTKDKKVRPETFARLARSFSDREVCEIVYLVASEHLNNLTNLGLNIHSDLLCDMARGSRA
jgi:alkylhydroperoxidase family enzyme